MTSEWKVNVGDCSHPFPPLREQPISLILPDNSPGLCPHCFFNDGPKYRTIVDRLESLDDREKRLLFRNMVRRTLRNSSTYLGRESAITSRLQMVRFASEFIPSAGGSPRREDVIRIYRFSWGRNPDPEDVRRILFDNLPMVAEDLRRLEGDYEVKQIRLSLVLNHQPSRSQSAWRNTLKAALKWPQNPIIVRIECLPDILRKWVYFKNRTLIS